MTRRHRQSLVLGSIVTMDPQRPRAEAMAVQDGRILAVGTESEARAALGAGAVHEWRMGEGTVVPGLIDTHNHMHWTGIQSRLVDLSGARSIAQIQEAIRRWAQAHPEAPWVVSGSGWHVASLA